MLATNESMVLTFDRRSVSSTGSVSLSLTESTMASYANEATGSLAKGECCASFIRCGETLRV